MIIFFKKNFGWLTILILTILPVARWFFMLPLNIRLFDSNAVMTSLGQIAGLLGMALFSLNLILASRLKFLDKYFYGLDKVYNYHRATGAIAFSLLLFHPLFLVVKYVQISLRSAALFLLPFTGDPAITYGIIALILMIALMSVTFYIKLKYQNWKISHKFMVAVFVFAILHTLYISSDISRDAVLRFYILALACLGLAAGFYRSFLSKFLNNNFTYKIIGLNRLNRSMVEIELKPTGRMIKFQAGQFVFLSFKAAGLNQEIHPFTIASSPREENLKFVIKALGDYTDRLENLRVGDLASVEGPFGKFSYKNVANKNQVWLAGGVGITPFLSMAGDLRDSDCKIDLYYCTKDKAEAVLLERLAGLSLANHNFKIRSWCSVDSGRINAEKIAELSQGLAGKDIFICGPAPFMESLEEQFLEMKIPASSIHWENFNLI